MEGYTKLTTVDGSEEWVIDNLEEVIASAKVEVINPNIPILELTQDEILQSCRDSKLLEINNAKKDRQMFPVEVRGVLFNGGRVAGQKYDEALRLAQKVNKLTILATGVESITKCKFGTYDSGSIEVDEQYADEIILAVGGATYWLWEKEQSYITQINTAITVAEIEAIVWTDVVEVVEPIVEEPIVEEPVVEVVADV